METLYQIMAIMGAGFIVWILYRSVKTRPELFNKENISRSFYSMGVLALILIAFVAFLIFMLRYS